MDTTSAWIFGIVMYAYLGVTVIYLIYAVTRNRKVGLVATVSLVLTLGVHTIGLGYEATTRRPG